MPGITPPITDERGGLLAYLDQQRRVLRTTAYGLTDVQARATPTVSALSVGGLIKHAGAVERSWMDTVLRRGRPGTPGEDGHQATFRLDPDDTLAGVLSGYAAAAAETSAVISGVADLGQPVPIPPDLPWCPPGVEAWSVRWVLLHLIAETARHAGHADIVRESVDGATALPLLAAAENWPPTLWLGAWQPDAGQA